jgi:hypothetical protein
LERLKPMTYDKTKFFKIIDDGKLKTSKLLKKCKKKFLVLSYWNDEELDKNFPQSKKQTTRYFKKTIEADENLANLSADDLNEKGIKGITLRERIIMEFQFFEETGGHLDIQNWTLCSGSRDSGGDVPDASWDGVRFGVDCSSSGGRRPFLRSREAVSLLPSSLIPSDTSELEMRVKVLEEAMDKIRKFLII